MSRRRGATMDRPDMAGGVEDMRADYSAAKSSRFRRRRNGMLLTGSGADYHYRNVFDYLKIMEYARDMDRNDAIVGQMVDRAVMNTIQNGLTVDPQTGDTKLDQAIKDRWNDWADDAAQCDLAGEHTFTDIEEYVLRSMLVDGDDFILPLESGQMQFIEAHRVRTPTSTKRNVVCGILLDDQRKAQEYWITKDDVDPFMPVALVGDVDKIPAWDAAGNKNVFHVKRGKRKTQTRGMSAFAPIFDMLGMHEDIQFANLVRQQIVSMIAFLRNRDKDFKGSANDPYGNSSHGLLDTARRLITEVQPGMELTGAPGEKIEGWSPNVPGESFFPHVRLMLQIIGINLGLPLVLLLMDASDTNFSGWRGAVDQARMGFKRNQGWLIEHFYSPTYKWKLRQFATEDRGIRTAMAALGKVAFKHNWNAPRWPYVQPLQDAQANQLRQQSLQSSPRRIQHEVGQDWDETTDEIVEDNGNAIEKAAIRAKALSKKIGERVSWRELLFLTDPNMLKAVVRSGEVGDGQGGNPGGGAGGSQGASPQPLNGLQITAAVDVLGKVRAGTVAPEAATQLMIGMGIAEANAKAMITATKAGEGAGAEAVDYARKIVLALLVNPTLAPLVANATNLGPTVKMAGLDQNTEYKEPYMPIVAPAGTPVSGGTLKDSDGDIVGGETVGENPKAGAGGAVPAAGGGDPNDPNAEQGAGGGTGNDETKPAGEDPADAPQPGEASPSARAVVDGGLGAGGKADGGVGTTDGGEGDKDPEDETRDTEDRPAKEDGNE